jgi:hypothetical protein
MRKSFSVFNTFNLSLCFIFLMATQASMSQTASYNFNGNLFDSSNGYNASGTGSFSFLSETGRDYVRLEEDALITLPTEVSNQLNAVNSFVFEFKYRINNPESVTDCCYPIEILSNRFMEAGIWGGFTFILQHFPGFTPEETYLIFSLTDGADDTGFYLSNSPDPDLDQWRQFSLRVDLNHKILVLQDAGRLIKRDLPNSFDVNLFKQGVLNNPFFLSGLQNNDPEISPQIDVDELVIFAPAPEVNTSINASFLALMNDLNGTSILTEDDKANHAYHITTNLYFADYTSIQDALFAYTNVYEGLNPPMYSDGMESTFENLGSHDKIMQYSQGYVFETQFIGGNAESMIGVVFEHHEVIPGVVPTQTPRVASANVTLNGSYSRDVAAMLTDQSRVVRPTGYYLAAGDVVTVSVPNSVITAGLSVIVGHHFRNMDYSYINQINRYPDISAEYPLDSSTIKIASPFGGGIYLNVPEGTTAGEFQMTIENAVKSPYFSWRSGSQSDVNQWLADVSSTGAPWADFESDKFMFTIPTDKVTSVTNPDQIMTRWNAILDAVNHVGGRPSARPRAEYYTFDTRLVTPAYGGGYPMVIPISEAFRNTPEEGWDPLEVMNYKPARTMLHEMGHNQVHPTLGYGGELDQCHNLEAETVVHNLALAVHSEVYGDSLEVAFQTSAQQKLTFEQAAFDWIITSTFRSNERIYEESDAPLEDTNQLHYQHRGHAKYGDIARLFGMDGLHAVHAQFYQMGQEQSSTVCNWRPFVIGRDEYIQAASDAIGVNMAPLLHFWGIKPSEQLISDLSSYPKSQEIKDLIIYYRENVAPKNIDDYMVFHDQFPTDDYQYPRYLQYINEFDAEFAQAIDNQFQYLLDLYFPVIDFIFASGFE